MSEVKVDYESSSDGLRAKVISVVEDEQKAESLIDYIESTYSPLIAKRAVTSFLEVLESQFAEEAEGEEE